MRGAPGRYLYSRGAEERTEVNQVLLAPTDSARILGVYSAPRGTRRTCTYM